MAKHPETLVPAADAVGMAAAHAMASALRDAGIQAFVFDTAKTALQWEAPGVIAPYQVHVARTDLDAARDLLEQNNDDSIDIDWNDVDVGQPEDDTSRELAGHTHAPWSTSTRHRPARDAAFGLAKQGLIIWVIGGAALAAVGAIIAVVRAFF
ncbi:MAG: DUF2007 domain-containing protein [Planctomycetota bacterium]